MKIVLKAKIKEVKDVIMLFNHDLQLSIEMIEDGGGEDAVLSQIEPTLKAMKNKLEELNRFLRKSLKNKDEEIVIATISGIKKCQTQQQAYINCVKNGYERTLSTFVEDLRRLCATGRVDEEIIEKIGGNRWKPK